MSSEAQLPVVALGNAAGAVGQHSGTAGTVAAGTAAPAGNPVCTCRGGCITAADAAAVDRDAVGGVGGTGGAAGAADAGNVGDASEDLLVGEVCCCKCCKVDLPFYCQCSGLSVM